VPKPLGIKAKEGFKAAVGKEQNNLKGAQELLRMWRKLGKAGGKRLSQVGTTGEGTVENLHRTKEISKGSCT
jgi:hypothetical protein